MASNDCAPALVGLHPKIVLDTQLGIV